MTVIKTCLCIGVITLIAGADAALAQTQNTPNSFYTPAQPSPPQQQGLTNPSANTIFVPNSPPRLLGGAPPPTPINPTDTNNPINSGVNASDTATRP